MSLSPVTSAQLPLSYPHSQSLEMKPLGDTPDVAPDAGSASSVPVAAETETQAQKNRPALSKLLPVLGQDVENHLKSKADVFLTPAQNTARILDKEIKGKWDIDLDSRHARIATFNYDLDKPRPDGGKRLNSTSLVDAALSNERSLNPEDSAEKPRDRLKVQLLHGVEFLSPFASIVNVGYEAYSHRDYYEYIFSKPDSNTGDLYDPANRLSVSPQAFRDLVWDTELVAPYKTYLDKFWPEHEGSYTQLSRLAFAKAGEIQFQEGGLTNHETDMVMRAAGYGSGKPLASLGVADIEKPYAKDDNLEVGFLSVGGSASTDLVYVTDKTPRMNAKGKKIHHTLLYIPGNSSPVHRFDSVQQMKDWFADQAADPKKRAALLTHFTHNDQDDKTFSDGVKQALVGMGGWKEAHRPNKWGFTSLNDWDPQTTISTHPVADDPFKVMTQRQKARSYADADHDITTDRDVNKKRAVNVLEAATAAALMLTPLAMVMPEVALGMDAVYVAAGVGEVGIGIDDVAHGKSTGTDRIVFGVLNALPVLLHGGGGGEKVLTSLSETESKAAAGTFPESGVVTDVSEVFDSETQRVELAGDGENGGTKRTQMESAEEQDGGSTAKKSKPDGNPRDLKKVNDLLFTYIDTYKGEQRLNIVVHGTLADGDKAAHLTLSGVDYDASELVDMLWDNGVETEKYANIRLEICNGGTGGEQSFAAQFHDFVGVPVKAYASVVHVDFNLDELDALFPKVPSKAPTVVQIDGVLPRARKHKVMKSNPFSADKASPEYKDHLAFSYQPVYFPPRTAPVRGPAPSMPELA